MLPTCANKCFSNLLLFSGAAFVALPTLLCHGQIKFVVVGDTQGTGANVASIVPSLYLTSMIAALILCFFLEISLARERPPV